MGRIIVGKASDISPGKMKKVTADGKEILVVNVDGIYCAIDDTCTHAGASLQKEPWMVLFLRVAGMEQNLTVKQANFLRFLPRSKT